MLVRRQITIKVLLHCPHNVHCSVTCAVRITVIVAAVVLQGIIQCRSISIKFRKSSSLSSAAIKSSFHTYIHTYIHTCCIVCAAVRSDKKQEAQMIAKWMTLNDIEWLFHEKMRFRPALLEAERLNVRNSTTSAILHAVFCALHDQLASLGRHAQLTRCFSAVVELLVYTGEGSAILARKIFRQRQKKLLF